MKLIVTTWGSWIAVELAYLAKLMKETLMTTRYVANVIFTL